MVPAPPLRASPATPPRRCPERAATCAAPTTSPPMPVLAEAVGDGRLSMDHVDLLGRRRHHHRHRRRSSATRRCSSNTAPTAALRPSRADRRLLEAARRRHRRSRRHQPAPADTAGLHASTMLDGVVRLDGTSTRSAAPPSSPSWTASMRQLAPGRPGRRCDPHRQRTRRAARVWSRWPPAPPPHHKAATPTPASFTVAARATTASANLCELANGTIIAPGHLVPYLDTALLRNGALFADPLTAVARLPAAATFTGRLRRAARRSPHPALRTPLRLRRTRTALRRRPHHPPLPRRRHLDSSTDGSNAGPTTATTRRSTTSTTPNRSPHATSPTSTNRCHPALEAQARTPRRMGLAHRPDAETYPTNPTELTPRDVLS